MVLADVIKECVANAGVGTTTAHVLKKRCVANARGVETVNGKVSCCSCRWAGRKA